MIVFFIYLGCCLDPNDCAFGIWSGGNMVDTRVRWLAKTWLQLVPSINVFTDTIDQKVVEEIVNSSNHLNITFHAIPTYGHHLVGSFSENQWNHAQSRHLVAFAKLYENNPNKKWYIMCDDDTYFFPEAIFNFLEEKNESELKIYGFLFFAFPEIEKYFISPAPHNFAQGGAGFFASKALMEVIGPHIRDCSKVFEATFFASDMRIAACMDLFVSDNGTKNTNEIYYDLRPTLNGYKPEEAEFKGQVDEKPLSFHHVIPPTTERLWNATTTRWTLANGTDVYVDWSHIGMTPIIADVGFSGNEMIYQFGYSFYEGGRFINTSINATTQFEPQFEQSVDEIPKAYSQKYQGGIRIDLICDSEMYPGEAVFDGFIFNEDEIGTRYLVHCEKPKMFPNNFPSGKSPLTIIHEEQSDL